VRILIVDDEFPAREILKMFINEITETDEIYEREDGQEAVDFLKKHDVDLVMLDIHMSVKDGLAAAEEINRLKNPPLIVFTTGYGEYALKAFEKKAVDYIMKPYSKDRLKQTFERIAELGVGACSRGDMDNWYMKKGKIPVWSKDRLVVIDVNDILFVTPHSKGKVTLVTRDGEFVYKANLGSIEKCFDSKSFIRVHKSYVVNLEEIEEILPWFNSTYMLSMKNYGGDNIPVSRHYIKDFKTATGIE